MTGPLLTNAQRLRAVMPTRLVNSTSVLMSSQMSIAVIRFISNLVLSRLLFPEAFGLMMVITSIMFIGELLTDLGFHPFVIRHEQGTDPHTLNVLWTMQLARGAVLALIIASLAPFLAKALDQPLLTAPLQVTALTFFMRGFHSFGMPLTRRAQQEWRNSSIEVGIAALRVCMTILLAWQTRSYWALVWGFMIGEVMLLMASYIFYKNPWRRPEWSRATAMEVWRFSGWILASGFLTAFIPQFDRLFVFRSLTLSDSGVYAVMLAIVGIAHQFVIAFYNRIYLAKTSEVVREYGPSSSAYYRPMRWMRPFFAFFIAAVVFATPAIVEVLFDDRYLVGSTFLSILILKPMMSAAFVPQQTFLICLKRMRTKFISDALRLLWLMTMLPLAFWKFGTLGLIWAVTLQDVPSGIYQRIQLMPFGIFRWKQEIPYFAAVLAGLGFGALVNLTYEWIKALIV